MLPVREFEERTRRLMLLSWFAREGGMLPVRELLWRSRAESDGRSASSGGIVPVSELLEKSRCCPTKERYGERGEIFFVRKTRMRICMDDEAGKRQMDLWID